MIRALSEEAAAWVHETVCMALSVGCRRLLCSPAGC